MNVSSATRRMMRICHGKNTDGDADCPLDVELSRDAGYEVRMVGGYPMKFEPSDRRLTRDAVIQFFESPGSFSAFRSQFWRAKRMVHQRSFLYI